VFYSPLLFGEAIVVGGFFLLLAQISESRVDMGGDFIDPQKNI